MVTKFGGQILATKFGFVPWSPLNSIAYEIFVCEFVNSIVNFVLLIVIFRSSDNTARSMARGITDDKSRLVQVIAGYR